MTLLSSEDEAIRKLSISALVRGKDKAKKLEALGVKPVLINDLNDVEVIKKAASEHDSKFPVRVTVVTVRKLANGRSKVVFNTASGFHEASAKAEVLGLAERKKQTGKDVYFIHTSGTSNVSDRPISGQYSESRIFSDKEDIYAYKKEREAIEKYDQRTMASSPTSSCRR